MRYKSHILIQIGFGMNRIFDPMYPEKLEWFKMQKMMNEQIKIVNYCRQECNKIHQKIVEAEL